MSSPGIDKWIEKHPEWWAEQVEKNTNQEKLSKTQFKKQLKKALKKINKDTLLDYINHQNIEKIYNNSKFGKTQQGGSPIKPKEKPTTKPRIITIKRKGKTYKKTTAPRWNTQKYNLSLKTTAKLKPRSKEYNEYVKLIMESTGRTRQAVTKKIQRVRKAL